MQWTKKSFINNVDDVRKFFRYIVDERNVNVNPDDMFEDYVFPQENGSHYNCQYASVGNLFAKGKKPFSFQASRYSEKELDEKAHNFELVPSDGIYVALDYKQSGIGSNSCGPRLAEKYQLREEKIEWEISLRFDNKN